MTEELLRKKKEVLLSSTLDIAEFCDKHNLTYYISYGSLIGAVRHGGFIPWDDDIDITMPSVDYNKFIRLWKKCGPKSKYFLQNKKTEPYFPLTFIKIRKHGTTDIEKDYWFLPMHWGISVDILPSYNAPKSKIFQKIFRKMHSRCEIHSNFAFYHYKSGKIKKALHRYISLLYLSGMSFFSRFNTHSGLVYSGLVGRIIPKDAIMPVKIIPFEDCLLYAPNDPHTYLTNVYKKSNYMVPPPEEERYGHPTAIVDVDMPYEEYIEKYLKKNNNIF